MEIKCFITLPSGVNINTFCHKFTHSFCKLGLFTTLRQVLLTWTKWSSLLECASYLLWKSFEIDSCHTQGTCWMEAGCLFKLLQFGAFLFRELALTSSESKLRDKSNETLKLSTQRDLCRRQKSTWVLLDLNHYFSKPLHLKWEFFEVLPPLLSSFFKTFYQVHP